MTDEYRDQDDCREWNHDVDPVAHQRERARFKESVSVLPVRSSLQFEYPARRSHSDDLIDVVVAL